MGWKAVKEHYGIEYDVQTRGRDLIIGSGYVPDLLTISPEGNILRNSAAHTYRKLDDLEDALRSDKANLVALLRSPDVFERAIPVFTFENGTIIELACEEPGWPNVTHDGRMQYENLFFATRSEAARAALASAESAVEGYAEMVAEAEKALAEARGNLARVRGNRDSYRSIARSLGIADTASKTTA